MGSAEQAFVTSIPVLTYTKKLNELIMAIKITEDSSGPEEVHTQDLDEEEVSTAMLDRSEMQLSVTLEQAPKKARKVTQIMAVVAVSVGAFIHGTVVSFPSLDPNSPLPIDSDSINHTIQHNKVSAV